MSEVASDRLHILHVVELPHGDLAAVGVKTVIHLDDDGVPTGRESLIAADADADEMDGLISSAAADGLVALFAVSLLHCRNVSTEQVVPPAALSRKHRRKHGYPLARHRRILVPTPRRAKGDTTQHGYAQDPLHMVRGHFKTYTADAPLFGQHVGTYWWSWAVRGNPVHGTIDHTYEVSLGGTP